MRPRRAASFSSRSFVRSGPPLDPVAVNLGVTIFVQVTLDLQVEGRLEIFEQAIMARPEVLECYLMTGDADYFLRVEAENAQDYEVIHKDVLSRLPGVARIKSSFAIKSVVMHR